MASSPAFFGTALHGRAELSTANANRDGTGSLVAPSWMGSGVAGADTAFTLGAPVTDWTCNRIIISQTGDLADSVITVFTTDGTTIKFLTDFDISNPTAASTTVTGLVLDQPLVDWVFPGKVNLLFGLTVAPTSGYAEIGVFGQRI